MLQYNQPPVPGGLLAQSGSFVEFLQVFDNESARELAEQREAQLRRAKARSKR